MEKEQKELERKKRKEEEKSKATQVKTTKKLSRRPPAAMDTQRMPAALRNASPAPRSQSQLSSVSGNSRSSSREGRRSSITSLVSFFGLSSSKSTPAQSPVMENYHPISPTPPQIGRLRAIDHSRSSSSDTFGIAISDDEDYVKELVAYAYEVQASPDDVEVKKLEEYGIPAPKSQSQQRAGATSSASRRTTDSPNGDVQTPINFSRRPLATRRGSSEENYLNMQKPVNIQYPYKKPESPNRQSPLKKKPSAERASSRQSTEHAISGRSSDTPSPDVVLTLPATSRDGGSYVHKQRMYQQQRSIAGYQDEMAIALANQPKPVNQPNGLGRPSMPPTPTPTDSAESLSEEKRIESNQARDTEQVVRKPHGAESHPSRDYVTNGNPWGNSAKSTPSRTNPATTISSVSSPERSSANRASETPSNYQDALEEQPLTTTTPGSPAVPARSKSRNSSFVEQFTVSAGSLKSDEVVNTREENGSGTQTKASTTVAPVTKPVNSRSSSGPTISGVSANQHPPRANRLSVSLIGVDVAARSIAYHQTQQASAARIPLSPNRPNQSVETPNTAKPRDSMTASKQTSENSAEQDRDRSPSVKSEATVKALISEGLLPKPPSIRSHSDPDSKAPTTDSPLPTLDFLPELKHQPLIKPKRTSPVRVSFASTPTTIPFSTPTTSSSSSSPPTKPTLPSDIPPSVLRSSLTTHSQPTILPSPKSTSTVATTAYGRRSSIINPTTLPLTAKGTESLEGLDKKPIGKLFVICCKCKHWHDLPSRLYEAMALPRTIAAPTTVDSGKENSKRTSVEKTSGLSEMWRGRGRDKVREGGKDKEEKGKGKEKGVEGKVEGKIVTVVKCPWCEHGMSTTCCQGWTTIVYLHQKHH
jgi:hypothetical protein